MSKTIFEFRPCIHCEAHYIEDCSEVVIEVGTGKPLLPKGCWRVESIKLTPKPHGKSTS